MKRCVVGICRAGDPEPPPGKHTPSVWLSKSHELSDFIWSIADLLRGSCRPPQYERVMLPLVVLRRFDCVLESTKDAVLAKYAQHQWKLEGAALDSVLSQISGQRFHNHSPLSIEKTAETRA